MANFLFDLDMRATVRVDAESEEAARAAIIGELDCFGPVATITAANGAELYFSEISPKCDKAGLELVEIDGEGNPIE